VDTNSAHSLAYLLVDFSTSTSSGTGGQETGQGDGREDANHSHNIHKLSKSEALGGHDAGLALGQAAHQLDLKPTFDES
jgi:hypothetical protein